MNIFLLSTNGYVFAFCLKFSVENSVINKSNDLVFHGLDGHATITFNQKVLGKAINSFIRYRFDVSKLLQVNKN